MEPIRSAEDQIKKAEELGRDYFRQGLNCSECVLRSFLDLHDVDLPDAILAMATGFGGGMGHTKNTCGAISGAVLALGTVKGRRNPFALETPGERAGELKPIYDVFGRMIREIEAEYGTLICRELSDPHGEFEGKTRKKNCQQLIGYCSALCAKYAAEE